MDEEYKFSSYSPKRPTIAFLTTVRTGEWNLLSWQGIIKGSSKKKSQSYTYSL